MISLKQVAALLGTEYSQIKATNIDDVIREAKRRGFDELSVDEDDMLTAAYFVSANCANTEWGSKVLRTGRVDMLFGVRLHLKEVLKV